MRELPIRAGEEVSFLGWHWQRGKEPSPISDQACFQHTTVSTCISVLQYLRLSTGVLAYRYWSTEPSVLTRRERKILRKQPHAANANPKIKLYYSEKRPFAQRKKIKNRPFHRCFPPFGGILPPATAIRPRPSDKKRFPNHLYESSLNRNVKFQVFKAFLETFFCNFRINPLSLRSFATYAREKPKKTHSENTRNNLFITNLLT